MTINQHVGWAGREVGENESQELQGSRVEMTAGPDNVGQRGSGVCEVRELVLGRYGAFHCCCQQRNNRHHPKGEDAGSDRKILVLGLHQVTTKTKHTLPQLRQVTTPNTAQTKQPETEGQRPRAL